MLFKWWRKCVTGIPRRESFLSEQHSEKDGQSHCHQLDAMKDIPFKQRKTHRSKGNIGKCKTRSGDQLAKKVSWSQGVMGSSNWGERNC